jgi:hypothetical protein
MIMPNIYKLKYTDKETAITDLIAKSVYTQELTYVKGIQAVVEIGLITDNDATFDNEGNIITEATYVDGYHYDVMSTQEIDFGSADVSNSVINPKHSFAGY